ncbi:flagellar export chaperone FliS [Legionella sp. km772]|uniref:flagellar export chaperone FliS n=1 Tax=Legionella sp. km772 TaxID=2498111 RepID=UPI000F8DDB2B|nr:flagellar export chaperone FliS [Legionella sp. km772]RUR09585.1 flagellar export chaperone FliS [Legionella sp. km772]
MNNPYKKITDKYKLVDLQTRIDAASPHELINLLFQGARTHVAGAIGCMQAEQHKAASEHISKTLNIINELRRSLNIQQGGEVAQNLLKFYNQIESLIVQSTIKQDVSLLVKTNELLGQLQEVWQSIKPS